MLTIILQVFSFEAISCSCRYPDDLLQHFERADQVALGTIVNIEFFEVPGRAQRYNEMIREFPPEKGVF